MYSNMCVKIALCLALIVSIDGYVLKRRTLALPVEGRAVETETIVRNKEDRHRPLSSMKIDINEKDKKLEMAMAEAPSGVPEHLSESHNIVPTLEDRYGIRVGTCPQGTEKRGGYCYPTDNA